MGRHTGCRRTGVRWVWFTCRKSLKRTVSLDTPEVTEMAQMQLEMFEEGSLVRPADVGASWCGEAIGKKLVGMTLEGGWMVNFMKQNYADVQWKAVEIPKGPKTRADV